jgi:hypothetical protein
MILPVRASVVGIALSSVIGVASAAEVCARAPDLIALQVAALQQRLMVAALTCGEAELYNRFVNSYRSELIASDDTLKDFFARFGEDGTSHYHAFKTKMANVYSALSNADPGQFCTAVRASFAPALSARNKDLAAFARSQPSIVNEPYTQCGQSIAGASMIGGPGVPALTGTADVSVKTRSFGANGYSERSYSQQRGERVNPSARLRQDVEPQAVPSTTHNVTDGSDNTGLYCYPSTGSWMRCYRVSDSNPRALYPYSYERNPNRPGVGRAGGRSQSQRRNY